MFGKLYKIIVEDDGEAIYTEYCRSRRDARAIMRFAREMLGRNAYWKTISPNDEEYAKAQARITELMLQRSVKK